LLVSVGHATCQRINYFYINEAISVSTEHLLVSSNWRSYLLQHVYCVLFTYYAFWL